MTTINIIDLIKKLHLFERPEEDYNKNFSDLDKIFQGNESGNLAHEKKLPAAIEIIENAIMKSSQEDAKKYVDVIFEHNSLSKGYLALEDFVYNNKPELIDMQSEDFADKLGDRNGFGDLRIKIINDNFNKELFNNEKLLENLLNNTLLRGSHLDNQDYKDVLTKISQHQDLRTKVNDYIDNKCKYFCGNSNEFKEIIRKVYYNYKDCLAEKLASDCLAEKLASEGCDRLKPLLNKLDVTCVDTYFYDLKNIFSFTDSEF